MRRSLALTIRWFLTVALISPPVFSQTQREVHSVTFEEAVNEALARNPTAQKAATEMARAEALVKQVRASALPTLYANGMYTRLDDDRRLGDRVIANANQLSANLTATIPLVHPQRWSAWSRASENVDVAKASSEEVRRQVALSVARAYLTVITTHRVLEVDELALGTSRLHAEYAHVRAVGGVGNRLDEARAQQEMFTNEAQVHTAEANLTNAREALGLLLGRETPVDANELMKLPDPPSPAAALGDAARLRADVRGNQARLRASAHAVRDNWTNYMPYLSGILQPFYQNPPTVTQPQWGWQAQLVLTLPIFDGGLRYGQEDERRAVRDEARISVEEILRQSRSEVRAAFEQVRLADGSLVAARQATDFARQSLQLATIAYRAGATSNIEVVDAERRARDADTQTALAEDTARQARLNLLAASGRFP